MTLRLAWFVTALRRYIGSSQTICPTLCVLSDELHPCPSVLIRGWTSPRACEQSRWNFFVSPLISNARSRRRVGRRFVVRQAQRLRRSGRAAAARSTGLRPIHFIHFIDAAVTNRGPNLPEGIRNHYRIVMFGKTNFCTEILHSLCTF